MMEVFVWRSREDDGTKAPRQPNPSAENLTVIKLTEGTEAAAHKHQRPVPFPPTSPCFRNLESVKMSSKLPA